MNVFSDYRFWIAVLLGFSGFIYIILPETEAPKPFVIAQVKQKVVEKEKVVKLKIHMTACQKLSDTIPLDAGLVLGGDIRIAKGFVENTGDLPVQFVQIQVFWKDRKDRIIEYDDIFAVAENVLMPGEKAPFQTSRRNLLIEKCAARMLDWWVVKDDGEIIAKNEDPTPG